MRVALACLALIGCNYAPVEYNDYGIAPGALGAWGGPTEICAPDLLEQGDLYIDGFYLCLTRSDLVPIDDPIIVPCTETPVDPGGKAIPPKGEIFYVFDGKNARGYPIEWLRRREAIHDTLGRVPVLVNW
ncbi:MAG: hypothetical protein ACI8PZ_003214 [Myxococcota bacterium]|jgi:hypothetical protein